MTDRTDDRLMADYVGGDERALRVLVERWERPVFSFLVRMLGSAEEAEDLCQETFVKLIQASGRYQAEGKFQSWIFRIAGNQARSQLRRRKVLRWLPLTEERAQAPSKDPDALELVEGREEQQRVREAIARLPERQRQALILKQYQEMRYQEIAEAMDSTVASVQMLLHRAMAALKKDLASRRQDHD